METLVTILTVRMIYVVVIAAGAIVLGFVAIVVLKKLDMWDRVRAFLEPIVRQKLKDRGGVAAVIERRIPGGHPRSGEKS